MITKKRSAGILLCLVWIAVFTMLRPASAAVTGTGTKADPYEVGTWSDLNTLMRLSLSYSPDDNRCNCYINLTDNITAGSDDTYLEVANDAIVFLDLNGKTIDRGLENPTENGYVIKVKGRLTLDDTVGGGKITGGNNSDNYSGGVYVESGSFTMNGGTIIDNSAGESSYGGGVYVSGSSASTITFIMNGGTISDNSASYGGGVYVASMGSFTLSGGTISGNRGGVAGGGVCVDGTFSMNDGTISGNRSSTAGSGVYVGGTFNMNDGTISGNDSLQDQPSYGGGVCVDGTFNMNKGTISGNNGFGGVYVRNGTFNISGAPIITGNQQGGTITDGTLSGGSVNNVYLPDGKYITVTGALDASALIGVTLKNGKGRFTDTAETNLINNDPGKFTSDNNDYEAGKFTAEAYPDIIRTDTENDEQLFLGLPVRVTNIKAKDKEYDGNTNAELDTSEAQFTDNNRNRIENLSVTAAGNFDNKDAGDAKTVNISDLSLTVPGATPYLPASSGQQTTAQAKITPKPLTVTPDSGQGKTFGAADPELTWTQSGLVGGDPISGALSREAGEDPGTYKITQGTLSAGGNYSLKFTENVVFTIIDKEPDGFYFFRLDSELPQTGITAAGSADIKDAVSYRQVNMELLIPQLDLTGSIVSVPHTEEGYPVRELGNDAGLLEGFALPGSGISLIAGHNTLDAESFGPFAAIRLLEAGDRFFVRRDDGELLRFEVYANEKIGSADVEGLRQTAEVCENSLTLLTCEDELPEGGYANRRIVSAKLIK